MTTATDFRTFVEDGQILIIGHDVGNLDYSNPTDSGVVIASYIIDEETAIAKAEQAGA